MDQTATPSANTQTQAFESLEWAISEMRTVLNPPPLTAENLVPRLLEVCRELADHLNAYAISGENFDEDAFWSCQKGETLLFEARRLLGPLASPQGDSPHELLETLKAVRDGLAAR